MTPENDNSGGWQNPPPDEIEKLLRESRKIAVVGLSSKENRPSNGVSAYLKKQGYQIIPVNPREDEILGEKCYPGLTDIPEKVDIVDIFRRAEETPEIVRKAIEIGAKAVWLQESIISEEAYEIGRKAGLTMIMDRCILKLHRQLIKEG